MIGSGILKFDSCSLDVRFDCKTWTVNSDSVEIRIENSIRFVFDWTIGVRKYVSTEIVLQTRQKTSLDKYVTHSRYGCLDNTIDITSTVNIQLNLQIVNNTNLQNNFQLFHKN